MSWWKTAVWCFVAVEHLHLAFSATEGGLKANLFFFFLYINRKNTTIRAYQMHSFPTKCSELQRMFCRRLIVGQGLLPLVPSSWLTWRKISRVGWGARAHTQTRSAARSVAAVLCLVTRQMIFFESSAQRAHTLAPRAKYSLPNPICESLSCLFFVWLNNLLFFFFNTRI